MWRLRVWKEPRSPAGYYGERISNRVSVVHVGSVERRRLSGGDPAEDLQGYSLYQMALYEVMYQCTAPMMCFGARPLGDNRYQ